MLRKENNRSFLPGLYVHVPFCRKKCLYCGFYSTTRLDRVPEYVDRVLREAEVRGARWPLWDTLYVGGGTPSVLGRNHLERLIQGLCSRFPFVRDAEITLEMNPGDMSGEDLVFLKDLGVNRLSMGVQSFDDAVLRFLGRRHDTAAARNAFSLARIARIPVLGIDLIYGIPGRTLDQWRRELRTAVSLEPEHISCYELTYEPGTPLERRCREGRIVPHGEAALYAFFMETAEILHRAGYEQYEVSNFARAPRFRSRHNQKYWSHVPYLGLGPAAHSFDGVERCWNHRSLDRWMDSLVRGKLPMAGREILDGEAREMERLYFGFRTRDGAFLPRGVGESGKVRGFWCRLEQEGFIGIHGGDFRPTLKGFAAADALTVSAAHAGVPEDQWGSSILAGERIVSFPGKDADIRYGSPV